MPYALEPGALRLLNYLLSVAPNVNPTMLKGFPTYSGIHAVLGLPLAGRNYGDSLDNQGMGDLAHWARDNGFPAIRASSSLQKLGDQETAFSSFTAKTPMQIWHGGSRK